MLTDDDIRDFFAMLAMHAALERGELFNAIQQAKDKEVDDPETVAKEALSDACYELADAMMARRAVKP